MPIKRRAVSLVLGILMLLGGCFMAAGQTRAPQELQSLADGILTWKLQQAGCGSLQELIDSSLTAEAGQGSADWYAVALRQSARLTGASFSFDAYSQALTAGRDGVAGAKATDRQRMAIAITSVNGPTDWARDVIDSTTGRLGIASELYGLILMDAGAYTSASVTRDGVIHSILSKQLTDGGWALTGSAADVDVTAMAVQALSRYESFDDVRLSLNRALSLLSDRQRATGDYASWGTPNAESTAQVLMALSAMGIDAESDSRFIKSNHTVLDGLILYRLEDGSFCHAQGGRSNDMASVQALCALTSMRLGGLYGFTDQTIGRVEPTTPVSASPNFSNPNGTQTTASEQEGGSTTLHTTQSAAQTAPSDSAESTTMKITVSSSTAESGTQQTSDGVIERTDGAYKPWAAGGIVLLAAAAIGTLFATKKNHLKNILLVLVLAAGALLVVCFTTVQTVEQYYAAHPDAIFPDSEAVLLSIRCDTVAGQGDAADIPTDGCILDKSQVVLREGDTVFTLLERVARVNRLPLDYSGSPDGLSGGVYVRGIQSLYEFDFGSTSGWVYKVNGQLQSVSCSDYTPQDGDVVEWLYTLDLGKDVS